MTKCAGITAEYNPFHNGHAGHIAATRQASGAERVIVVMSGCFTQRGEPAIADKFTRTEWALSGGADMVLELPVAFSLGNAQRFAFGAISTLKATGLVGTVSFGSECGDIAALKKAAVCTSDDRHIDRALLQKHLAQGKSYPRAVADMLVDADTEAALTGILSSPNDILAIEYLKAIEKTGVGIQPLAVKRVGTAHDAADDNDTASALAIRNAIFDGDITKALSFMPCGIAESAAAKYNEWLMPYSREKLGDIAMFALRAATAEQLGRTADISEGMENLLKKAAISSGDYEALLKNIKTKRYTLSRLKRVVMSALIGINSDDALLPPSYIRVLGVRRDAQPLLSEMAGRASLPIIVRGGDGRALDGAAARLLSLDSRAWELYCGILPARLPIIPDLSHKLIVR